MLCCVGGYGCGDGVDGDVVFVGGCWFVGGVG